MKTFFMCLLIVSTAYLYKSKKKKIHTNGNTKSGIASSSEAVQMSFYELENIIDELARLKEELEEIENMITDIESCDPDEHITAFNISVPAFNHSAVLLANSSSENILNLLYCERKRRRSSIIKIISNLSVMCRENVGKSNSKKVNRGVIEND